MTNPNFLDAATTEEIRLLRLELTSIREELAEAKADRDGFLNEGDELRHQLQVLRASFSWKLTRPLRSIRRRLFRRGEF